MTRTTYADGSGASRVIDWTQRPQRVRIKHNWGHGSWHDIKHEADLIALCNRLNARHPDGCHHTEYTSLDDQPSATETALRQITEDSSHAAMQQAWLGDYRARMDLLAPHDQAPKAPMWEDAPDFETWQGKAEDDTFWPAVWHGLASLACIALCGIAGMWLALAWLGVW